MTTKITITRALATIKALEGKIVTAIVNQVFTAIGEGVEKARSIIGSEVAVEVLEDRIKKDFQSLQDMITQRDALKRAVILSNALTKVVIAGKEYTVAEAIETKRSISIQQNLLDHLKRQVMLSRRNYNQTVTAFNDKLEKARATVTSRDKKITEEDYALTVSPVERKHTPFMIDPLNADNLIAKMDKEIQDFILEVDLTLSESNASTTVEV